MENCCPAPENKKGGIIRGIIYGIIPHSFCIAFIAFSAIGAMSFAAAFRNFLEIPYFIQIMLFISFAMATISAGLYLRKCNCMNGRGIKRKWKYLAVLYGVTIATNLLMFSYVLPALANTNSGFSSQGQSEFSIKVAIPCAGHAPIITQALEKDNGVKNVLYVSPNTFKVSYDPSQTSQKKIESMAIFQEYEISP